MASLTPVVGAIIQARMSSRRLPGKVLSPLAGKPVIEHVFGAVAQAVDSKCIVIATSTDRSDDPLVRFCEGKGYSVYRGPLNDVFSRFQGAVSAQTWSGFFRVCADSPFYSPDLLSQARNIFEKECPDLVTNVFPRSFPKGFSVELFRREPFLALSSESLNEEEREHVSPYYYRHPDMFRIRNFSSSSSLAEINLCVDTLEDYELVERFCSENPIARLFEYPIGKLTAAFRR